MSPMGMRRSNLRTAGGDRYMLPGNVTHAICHTYHYRYVQNYVIMVMNTEILHRWFDVGPVP